MTLIQMVRTPQSTFSNPAPTGASNLFPAYGAGGSAPPAQQMANTFPMRSAPPHHAPTPQGGPSSGYPGRSAPAAFPLQGADSEADLTPEQVLEGGRQRDLGVN